MKNKLTIAIANYNYAKLLKRCIDSIYNQDSNISFDFEVLVIDDASNDNSKEVCKEYKNKYKNFNYIIKNENKGLGDSRNLAISNCLTSHILFIDADDYFYKDAFYEINKINDWKDVLIFNFSRNGKKHFNENILNQTKEETFKQSMHYIWSKIYKIDIIKDNNISALEINHLEDYSFTPVYFNYVNDFVLIIKPLMEYYLNPNSMISKQNNKSIRSLKQLELEHCDVISKTLDKYGPLPFLKFYYQQKTYLGFELHSNKRLNVLKKYFNDDFKDNKDLHPSFIRKILLFIFIKIKR